MGFAYANRAAVLVNLGHFKEAIQDVNLALKNKYPESQAEKLVQRKDRCEKAIQKKEEENSAIDPKVKKEMEAEIKKMQKLRDDMLKVHNPNPLIPAAAEFVEIKYDKVQVRHLAVNEDIPAGTQIVRMLINLNSRRNKLQITFANDFQELSCLWRTLTCLHFTVSPNGTRSIAIIA